jgi:biopolymer transport protein ExbB/TolQ
MAQTEGLIGFIVGLPIFEAEWVLYLLFALSLASVAVMVERFWFYQSRRLDVDTVRERLDALLSAGDYDGAASYLEGFDTLETNVTLFGLRAYQRGPEAVEALVEGAASRERLRYGRRLGFLATVGSNAPFIGLFGTVLGIIKAFQDLSTDLGNAAGTVMAGISEALVATAVGLLVAIPAVVAYNLFSSRVKDTVGQGTMLARTLISQLKSAEPAPGGQER